MHAQTSSKKSTPSSKAAAAPPKRKESEPATEETDTALAAPAPPAKCSKLKAAFLAQYKEPMQATRTLRTGGQTTPTVTVTGIVTRVGFNPEKTKIQAVVEVHKINTNNAPDVVVSGVKGWSWLLPSFKAPPGDGMEFPTNPGGALHEV